jgi:hypothetical protein
MKYKLRTDLPDAKKGSIFEFEKVTNCYHCNTEKGVFYSKQTVETQPYFFELIEDNLYQFLEEIQNNYRVEAFKNPNNGNIYHRNPNGTYGFGLNIPFEVCLGRYLINKVSVGKNEQGVKIGTRCKLLDRTEVVIEKFLVVNNVIKIITKNSSHYLQEIDQVWEEQKQPKEQYIILPNKTKIPIVKGLQITFN